MGFSVVRGVEKSKIGSGQNMSMIWRWYTIKGLRVKVIARADWTTGGPRNVMCVTEDGYRFIRPFRGLRRER